MGTNMWAELIEHLADRFMYVSSLAFANLFKRRGSSKLLALVLEL